MWRAMATSPKGALGIGVFVVLLLASFVLVWVSPHSANATDGTPLTGPSAEYWFGTDNLGRDLMLRVAIGIRTSLVTALSATLIAALVGWLSGMLAGYFGGKLDAIVMRLWDVVLAFPSMILAIAIGIVVGPGIKTTILAIAIIGMPSFARLARAGTLSERGLDYVTADVAAGAREYNIVTRSILPNVSGPLLAYFTISVPHAIMLEASLAYLGLGQKPPTPSLGGMISDSQRFLDQSPWFFLFPSLALFLLITSILLVGQQLSDLFDPSRRFRSVVNGRRLLRRAT
jgi:peptide/nickel transport system permease protein